MGMTVFILLLLVSVFIPSLVEADSLVWAKKAGASGNDQGVGITVLPDGITLVTGHFDESVAIFGEGETNETSLVSAGADDIFVAKYNPNGTLAGECQGSCRVNRFTPLASFAS